MRRFCVSILLLILAVFLLCSCQTTASAFAEDITACIASSEHALLGIPICSTEEAKALKAARRVSETLPVIRSADENGALHEVPLAQNDARPTYYLPLDAENADWDSITLHTGAALFVVSDELLPAKADALRNGTAFTLLICGEQFYSEARLICTGLPMLKIDLYDKKSGKASASTDIQSSPSYMYFSYYHANDPLTNAVASATSAGKIHTRGGTSAKYSKHSFRFSLYDDITCNDQNNLALCGLRLDDDWILNAMYQEETKVRDMLSYGLWEDIGADHYGDGTVLGTRMRYVEVILGGKYWGLYGLCEPEDAKQFGISETSPGAVYKVGSWAVPSVKDLRNAIINDIPQVAEVEVKYPEVSPETSRDAWKPFTDYVEVTYESSDFYFSQQIGNIMDEDNLADLWIFLNLIAGRDNCWKNLYLSYRADVGKLLISPWDCDISFGLNWQDKTDLHLYHEPDNFRRIMSMPIFDRYLDLNVNDFRSTLADRWQQLREDWLCEEEIMDRANAYRAQLTDSGALNRNRKKWPDSGDTTDLSYIEEFVNFRIPYLDAYIADLLRS
ncbi:MAG: CotH kinase family protein [Clostridia bacterium]|nr:CotH kinase family protein [Clostridia bacterium]